MSITSAIRARFGGNRNKGHSGSKFGYPPASQSPFHYAGHESGNGVGDNQGGYGGYRDNSVDQRTSEAWNSWERNFYGRRIIETYLSHIANHDFCITSGHADIDKFAQSWWNHPKNKISTNFRDWMRELLVTGELFFRIHTDTNGKQIIRPIPQCWVLRVETHPNDYACPVRYHILTGMANEPTTGTAIPAARTAAANPNEPVMVHYTLYKRVGNIRGSGGILQPVLPSILRYTSWIRDRILVNKRGAEFLYKIKAKGKDRFEKLMADFQGKKPKSGTAYVYQDGEDIQTLGSNIGAWDAESDGKAIARAISIGANLTSSRSSSKPLSYMPYKIA